MEEVRLRETVQTYELTSPHGLVTVVVMFTRWKRKMVLSCDFVPLEQQSLVDAIDANFYIERITKTGEGGCRITVTLREDKRKAEALELLGDLFIEHALVR